MQLFKKDDILVGYHGKVVTNIHHTQYCLQLGITCEHVLQIGVPLGDWSTLQVRTVHYRISTLTWDF